MLPRDAFGSPQFVKIHCDQDSTATGPADLWLKLLEKRRGKGKKERGGVDTTWGGCFVAPRGMATSDHSVYSTVMSTPHHNRLPTLQRDFSIASHFQMASPA